MKKRNKIIFVTGAVAVIAGSVYATWHYLKTKALQNQIDSIPYEIQNKKDRRAAWYMKYLGR